MKYPIAKACVLSDGTFIVVPVVTGVHVLMEQKRGPIERPGSAIYETDYCVCDRCNHLCPRDGHVCDVIDNGELELNG